MIPHVFGLEELLPIVRQLHEHIRQRVVEATDSRSTEDLSQIVAHEGGDTVFAIDRVSEAELIEFLSRELASREPVVLIVEGIADGKMILPRGASEDDCKWRIIVDPIDGTRCLMYQKRSGWILTGVAPNRGDQTTLADIQLAVQTEIPLLKQHLCDQMWAIRGQGASAERFDRTTGQRQSLALQPSRAETIRNGYAAIVRFFPGLRDVLAGIDDDVVHGVLGPTLPGSTLTFEDQYPSTGGQLFSLASGADRFIADLRPLMRNLAADRGQSLGHCCHPYDICTMLIAEELGVAVVQPGGQPIAAPLDVESDVAWIGYANATIRAQVEPVLQRVLKQRKIRF